MGRAILSYARALITWVNTENQGSIDRFVLSTQHDRSPSRGLAVKFDCSSITIAHPPNCGPSTSATTTTQEATCYVVASTLDRTYIHAAVIEDLS